MSTRSKASPFIVSLLVFLSPTLVSAAVKTNDLSSADGLTLHNAVAEAVTFKGKQGIRVESPANERPDAGTARLRPAGGGGLGRPGAGEANRVDRLVVVDEDFHDGTIELEIAGQPGPGASGGARGFVGVAFRVQPGMQTYDCFYLRPTNGRADDQERRNHSAQYISHPDFPWFRLREETPGKYEAYVDLVPAEWTKVKIVVEGDKARLYVHDSEHPTLIVNDLKSNADGKGAVALWFEGSTIAHYRALKITK